MANRVLYPVPLKERLLLNKGGSDRECYHLTLDLHGLNACYRPGDCVGIFPENHSLLVDRILKTLHFTGNESVIRENRTYNLREFLTLGAHLSRLSSLFYPKESSPPSLLDFLEREPPLSLTPQELASRLPPLLPRLYSIASSMKEVGEELHLLVKKVCYEEGGRIHEGTASSFLCTHAPIGYPLRLYFDNERPFSLPKEPNSIIMIGAGTGIAPFRAFMQERKESSHPNWLFFGERRRTSDFYYEEFWNQLVEKGKLKLDLAFSRDDEKNYVQDKMREKANELWKWIQTGATIYVCGNAAKMGKGVDDTLHHIAQEQGGMNPKAATEYVRQLRKSGRYLRDIY